MRKKEERFIDKKKRIAECRIEKGLTQKELAQKTGIVISTFRNYEQLVTSYKREVAEKIADVLEVDTRYLTYESDFKNWKDKIKNNEKNRELQRESLFYWIMSHNYKIFHSDASLTQNNELLYYGDDRLLNNKYKVFQIITPDQKELLLNENDLELFEKMMVNAFNGLLYDYEDLNWIEKEELDEIEKNK